MLNKNSTWLWIIVLILFLNFQLNAAESKKQTPTHLLFMVFDQMRPDYIERFDLKNFKRLRKMGTNYKNAYVGHLASVTVVSHAVMTTGLLPTDLPWSENIFWDQDGKLGPKVQTYSTTNMAQEQYLKLLADLPANQFLANRFKTTTKKSVFAIGEKDYATTIMGGPYSDSIIYAKKVAGQCKPTGVNIPDYISKQDRYNIDCTSTYGTEHSLYPLDGNHFFPGKDKSHLGGDIWVADLALDVMNHESNWGALFLTFGAIDRFGHMLGETDNDTPHAFETPLHLKDIAQIADAQLGRILDELKKKNILNETMIVVTADHGGQTNNIFLGNPSGNDHIFWIQRIAQMAPVRFTTNDTGLRIWLKDPTPENIQKTGAVLREISQVTEVFAMDRSGATPAYKSLFQNFSNQSKAFKNWAIQHGQELVNTCLNKTCPDIVAALSDDTGFGKLGDHGGFQEKVQRIPMIVVGPGIKTEANSKPMRLVDLPTLIGEQFKLPQAPKIIDYNQIQKHK